MQKAQQFSQSQNKSLIYSKYIPYQTVQKFHLPLLLTFLHIPLGLLLYSSNVLALIHPLLVFFLGLYLAVRKNEKLQRVAYLVAYIVGSEVLWRMAKSPVPWEFGKYGAAAIMIVALVQRGYSKFPLFPLFYLIFLIPACLLTIMNNSLGDARSELSFNMSGPFLLFISCWFFSYLKVNTSELKKLLIMVSIPLVAVAFTTLFITASIENIQFGTESNFATSGGYGPNQVSSMLGMGVFLCLAVYILFKNNLQETAYLSFLAILFAAQSILTFSRGGMYNALGATLAIVIFQFRNPGEGVKRMLPVLGIVFLFLVLVFPYLDDFTGGALQTRFEDTKTSGRLEIVEADFQIFSENPLLGAGVGEARDLRKEYFGKAVGSHTEFTRVLSEHGLLGVIALFVLGAGSVYSIIHQKETLAKGLAAGAVIWSCLFMMNAGMRLAAPSFLWGLSFLTILTPQIRQKILRKSFR